MTLPVENTVRRPRMLELDFIRGIAIVMVMGFHFEQAPPSHFVMHAIQAPFKLFGNSGVDLFFVLSGFLVGGLLLKEYLGNERIDRRKFIFRRGLKIWPAYYFYILFQAVVRRHPLSTFLPQNLLHLQNYLGTSLGHTWTLSVEEHFYLLLTLALGWMASRSWPIARVLKYFLWTIIAVICIRCLTVFEQWPGASLFTHNRLDSLLIGVVLAILFHAYPAKFEGIASKKWILASVAAVALAFRCLIPSEAFQHSIGFTLVYVGYAALFLLIYRHSGHMTSWAGYRWIANIGVYSYGIYLWQNAGREPVLRLSVYFPEVIRWPLILVGQYSFAILLGILSTHLVEWPFLRLRERLLPSGVPLKLKQEAYIPQKPEAVEKANEKGDGISGATEVLVP